MSRKGKPSLVVRLVRLSMTLKRIWGQIKPDIALLYQIRSGWRARMCLQQTRKALGKQGALGHSGCETEWLDVRYGIGQWSSQKRRKFSKIMIAKRLWGWIGENRSWKWVQKVGLSSKNRSVTITPRISPALANAGPIFFFSSSSLYPSSLIYSFSFPLPLPSCLSPSLSLSPWS